MKGDMNTKTVQIDKTMAATTSIGRLKVQGAPAPRNSAHVSPMSATARLNRPASVTIGKSCPFMLKPGEITEEVAVPGLLNATVPVRKMEHLSRVKTANFGMSTMDTALMNPDETDTFFRAKPHFVLCGIPVGAKTVDPHLYLSEARVGNFKTTARAVYRARRPYKSAKVARSEPLFSSTDGDSDRDEMDEAGAGIVPPMPPVTPISFPGSAKTKRSFASIGTNGLLQLEGHRFLGSSTQPDWEFMTPHELILKQKKVNLANTSKREHTTDGSEQRKEIPTLHTAHIQSLSLNAPALSNGLTVSSRNFRKLGPRHSTSTKEKKLSYNNPYRNVKQPERVALANSKNFEFKTLDSYVAFQKEQAQNGRTVTIPRAILRVPNPCSETFLLQMMSELNRPKTRRPVRVSTSAKLSDVSGIRDLEDFVHTKTSDSLVRTQSNIDRFQSAKKSVKSVYSVKSETIAEEAPKIETVSEQEEQDIEDT